VRFVKANFLLYQTTQLVVRAELAQARVFFWNQVFFAFCKFLSHQSSGLVLQVPPNFSFKKLMLSTGLLHYTKISTTLKAPEGLRNTECNKEQLSNWPPILYVAETDILLSKEEPLVVKVLLL
jgi:hypothetical protein